MGFCTSVNQNKTFFDKETYSYLLERKELLGELYKLLLDFNHCNLPGSKEKTWVDVTNNWGEKIRLNLIGINATSLISSEMKGSVTFTFIKDICEIKKAESSLAGSNRVLKLIKTNKI